MRFLHTESSRGWGGQEIRILREAEGLRKRGHEIFLAVNSKGGLIPRARDAGFVVYEIPFKKSSALKAVYGLVRLIKEHQIDVVNTHSSLDAWIGGIAARIAKKKIVRTRHLSTPIRKGLNSHLLYRGLADFVVTTSSTILTTIQQQAGLEPNRLQCVPTGIDPFAIKADPLKAAEFRASLGVGASDILVGTACFVRSWKGIQDLLHAAALLKHRKEIKWAVVGGGHVNDYRSMIHELGLEGIVTFVGHLEAPYSAMRAMDIFTLLSTAHEGISQASLQAAYLERPLITTTIGGLPEVCLEEKTGFTVPPFSPEAVAKAVCKLVDNPSLRAQFGSQAKQLVESQFTLQHTLDAMEKIFESLA